MNPRVRTTLNLHVESGAEIEAHERDGHQWISLGHVGVFFDDDADVSRLIHELEILRHRMRERAHLPVEEGRGELFGEHPDGEHAPDPVAESLDREQETAAVSIADVHRACDDLAPHRAVLAPDPDPESLDAEAGVVEVPS